MPHFSRVLCARHGAFELWIPKVAELRLENSGLLFHLVGAIFPKTSTLIRDKLDRPGR